MHARLAGLIRTRARAFIPILPWPARNILPAAGSTSSPLSVPLLLPWALSLPLSLSPSLSLSAHGGQPGSAHTVTWPEPPAAPTHEHAKRSELFAL